jgi:hypothetical protein
LPSRWCGESRWRRRQHRCRSGCPCCPDGYTLLMATTGVMAINNALYPDMTYDAAKDFEPVIFVASITCLGATRSSCQQRARTDRACEGEAGFVDLRVLAGRSRIFIGASKAWRASTSSMSRTRAAARP